MNRLDKHVGLVRSKLTTEQFLRSLGYTVAAFFAAVLVAVLIDRLFWVDLPRQMIWFWAGIGATALVALIHAMIRRPTPHEAATLIDEKLGLKEKFSTALYARMQGSSDPFVLAAIRDAEQTADNVSLHRRFPIAFPRSAYAAITAGLVVLLVSMLVGQIDLFDHHKKAQLAQAKLAQRLEAQREAQSAMAAVNSAPPAVAAKEKVELAKQELQHVLDQPNADPSVVRLTAKTAEEEAKAAELEDLKNNQAFAQALADKAVFNSLNPRADDHGPVADASKDIAGGNFSKAVDALQSLPAQFNEMTAQQKQQAIDQMKVVANQLQKIASDPAAMQNLQKQLQQQGVSQQQVQQAAQLAKQAAQGNQQAQQQLQQMQQQVMKQMNGGKGPTQQQQQAINKMMQQMQSVANSQTTAMQMTSGAQQMVQGMQLAQAASQGGTPSAKAAGAKAAQASGQAASGQSPSGQQGGSNPGGSPQGAGQKPGQQAGQQPGQQPGGQQGGAQQPGGQQPGQPGGGQQNGGKQPGGQAPGGQQGGAGGNGQNAQQQMQRASQQMAQALGQMDAVQKDAQQLAAAENAGDDSNDPNQNSGGADKPQPGGQNPAQGHGNQQGNGMGAPPGFGGAGQKELAQYTVKQEFDPTQNIANGKVLAKTFVKTAQDKGQSTIELSPAEKAAVKESTDDVSEESVPKDAQKAVKEYFDTVGQ